MASYMLSISKVGKDLQFFVVDSEDINFLHKKIELLGYHVESQELETHDEEGLLEVLENG